MVSQSADLFCSGKVYTFATVGEVDVRVHQLANVAAKIVHVLFQRVTKTLHLGHDILNFLRDLHSLTQPLLLRVEVKVGIQLVVVDQLNLRTSWCPVDPFDLFE